MPEFTVIGQVIQLGRYQKNIAVENTTELRQFWESNQLDTILDWSGASPPLVTVSANNLVAQCIDGSRVAYTFMTEDRANGRGIRGISIENL